MQHSEPFITSDPYKESMTHSHKISIRFTRRLNTLNLTPQNFPLIRMVLVIFVPFIFVYLLLHPHLNVSHVLSRKEFGLHEPLQLSMEEICRDIFLAFRQEKCHTNFFHSYTCSRIHKQHSTPWSMPLICSKLNVTTNFFH